MTPPLPCYALDYDSTDPKCQQCPFSVGCAPECGAKAAEGIVNDGLAELERDLKAAGA